MATPSGTILGKGDVWLVGSRRRLSRAGQRQTTALGCVAMAWHVQPYQGKAKAEQFTGKQRLSVPSPSFAPQLHREAARCLALLSKGGVGRGVTMRWHGSSPQDTAHHRKGKAFHYDSQRPAP